MDDENIEALLANRYTADDAVIMAIYLNVYTQFNESITYQDEWDSKEELIELLKKKDEHEDCIYIGVRDEVDSQCTYLEDCLDFLNSYGWDEAFKVWKLQRGDCCPTSVYDLAKEMMIEEFHDRLTSEEILGCVADDIIKEYEEEEELREFLNK